MLNHTEATLMHMQVFRKSLLLLVRFYTSETHVQLDKDHASVKSFSLFGLKKLFGRVTVLLHCSKIRGFDLIKCPQSHVAVLILLDGTTCRLRLFQLVTAVEFSALIISF